LIRGAPRTSRCKFVQRMSEIAELTRLAGEFFQRPDSITPDRPLEHEPRRKRASAPFRMDEMWDSLCGLAVRPERTMELLLRPVHFYWSR
jgi:hypothetical protein